jgi:molybdopterin molybdotransferase
MMTVEEAHEAILARFQPLPAERVPLADALGRVLREDAVAPEDLPSFANSAMDGYAVRSTDTSGAAEDAPRRLRLAGEVPAGSVYADTLQPGEAVRILTGAPIPPGADAVIQQELTRADEDAVDLLAAVGPHTNVRDAGDDVRRASLLVPAGTEIGPAEIALLAALGVDPITVTRRPRVAILATGDELAGPGQTPQLGQIRDSNSPYLAAAVARAGAEPWPLGIARDNAEDLRAHLDIALSADLVLTSGGVSVGTYDLVKQVLAEKGAIEFWRVRMRPGKPLAFGPIGTTYLLGLPGNPVSTAVTFELFGRPAIRRMLGCATLDRPLVEVTLAGEAIPRIDRRTYVRARLSSHAGQLLATPTGPQGSHIITSLLGAGALLVIHEGTGAVQPGEVLQARLLVEPGAWGGV